MFSGKHCAVEGLFLAGIALDANVDSSVIIMLSYVATLSYALFPSLIPSLIKEIAATLFLDGFKALLFVADSTGFDLNFFMAFGGCRISILFT